MHALGLHASNGQPDVDPGVRNDDYREKNQKVVVEDGDDSSRVEAPINGTNPEEDVANRLGFLDVKILSDLVLELLKNGHCNFLLSEI